MVKQAPAFCFSPRLTLPLHQGELAEQELPFLAVCSWTSLFPRLRIAVKGIGSSYFLAVRPGMRLSDARFPHVENGGIIATVIVAKDQIDDKWNAVSRVPGTW